MESEKKWFIIDSWEKLSLDKNSPQIQAKSCDFIWTQFVESEKSE